MRAGVCGMDEVCRCRSEGKSGGEVFPDGDGGDGPDGTRTYRGADAALLAVQEKPRREPGAGAVRISPGGGEVGT